MKQTNLLFIFHFNMHSLESQKWFFLQYSLACANSILQEEAAPGNGMTILLICNYFRILRLRRKRSPPVLQISIFIIVAQYNNN